MKKVKRNLSTPAARKFWQAVKKDAAAVRKLPSWKRAGVK